MLKWTCIRAAIRDFITVGMPGTAGRESRERIKSALMNSGFGYPNKSVKLRDGLLGNREPTHERKLTAESARTHHLSLFRIRRLYRRESRMASNTLDTPSQLVSTSVDEHGIRCTPGVPSDSFRRSPQPSKHRLSQPLCSGTTGKPLRGLPLPTRICCPNGLWSRHSMGLPELFVISRVLPNASGVTETRPVNGDAGGLIADSDMLSGYEITVFAEDGGTGGGGGRRLVRPAG